MSVNRRGLTTGSRLRSPHTAKAETGHANAAASTANHTELHTIEYLIDLAPQCSWTDRSSGTPLVHSHGIESDQVYGNPRLDVRTACVWSMSPALDRKLARPDTSKRRCGEYLNSLGHFGSAAWNNDARRG